MNAYPINVEPINDVATYNSAGGGVISLEGDGESSMVLNGSGVATVLLAGTAEAIAATLAQGEALIAMTAAGDPETAITADGQAAIALSGEASPQTAVKASGDVPIVMTGLYAIPRSIPVPDVYTAATSNRSIFPPSDNRVIKVPLERYTLVRPVDRVQRIEKEARSA